MILKVLKTVRIEAIQKNEESGVEFFMTPKGVILSDVDQYEGEVLNIPLVRHTNTHSRAHSRTHARTLSITLLNGSKVKALLREVIKIHVNNARILRIQTIPYSISCFNF